MRVKSTTYILWVGVRVRERMRCFIIIKLNVLMSHADAFGQFIRTPNYGRKTLNVIRV